MLHVYHVMPYVTSWHAIIWSDITKHDEAAGHNLTWKVAWQDMPWYILKNLKCILDTSPSQFCVRSTVVSNGWSYSNWSKCNRRLATMDGGPIVPQTMSLRWRQNNHDGVSNHQPHGCLLNRLFRRRSKNTSKLCVTDLCAGNSPGPVNSPHNGPVTRKMFPFDDVIMAKLALTGLSLTSLSCTDNRGYSMTRQIAYIHYKWIISPQDLQLPLLCKSLHSTVL